MHALSSTPTSADDTLTKWEAILNTTSPFASINFLVGIALEALSKQEFSTSELKDSSHEVECNATNLTGVVKKSWHKQIRNNFAQIPLDVRSNLFYQLRAFQVIKDDEPEKLEVLNNLFTIAKDHHINPSEWTEKVLEDLSKAYNHSMQNYESKKEDLIKQINFLTYQEQQRVQLIYSQTIGYKHKNPFSCKTDAEREIDRITLKYLEKEQKLDLDAFTIQQALAALYQQEDDPNSEQIALLEQRTLQVPKDKAQLHKEKMQEIAKVTNAQK